VQFVYGYFARYTFIVFWSTDEKTTPLGRKLIGFLLAFSGFVFLGISIPSYLQSVDQLRNWHETDGVIMQSSFLHSRIECSATYLQTVQFMLRGEVFTFQERTNCDITTPRGNVGDQVTVLYNPTNPYDAVLKSSVSFMVTFGMLFVLIAFLLSLGMGVLFLAKRTQPESLF